MTEDPALPALEDILCGARILFVAEWSEEGVEWTALTLDNGFILQFSGSAVVCHPAPN